VTLCGSACYQVPRIARIRGIPEATLLELIDQHTPGRVLGFLGKLRVNVLALNLTLDKLDVE
jgi:K+-transporting ATPase ATPase C chain